MAGLFICFSLFLHWSLLRVPTSFAILSHRLSTSGPTFFSALVSLLSSPAVHELAPDVPGVLAAGVAALGAALGTGVDAAALAFLAPRRRA